jgi:hypothetical protein
VDHCLSSERRAEVNEKWREVDGNVDEMTADFLEKRRGVERRELASLCLSKETALEREAVAAMRGLIAASASERCLFCCNYCLLVR